MRVFVTGASGFIGSAVVRELLDAGHEVLGLARSDEGAAAVATAGAQVLRGSLEDLDSLRRGAADSDGVVHTAFIHDFANHGGAIETERRVVTALGEVLAGSGRPLVVSSGSVVVAQPGRPATEQDPSDPSWLRLVSEETAFAFVDRGVRASVLRLPPTVHGAGDRGFVPIIIDVAREKGVSAYPGDGANRWAAVHRLDAANLFRLALESAPAGTTLHAAAEEGVPVREIAEVVGRHLDVPVRSIPGEESAGHFGFVGQFLRRDVWVSSAWTRERFGWQPVRPGLIVDLEKGHYFTRP
ncbi:SDR family oxidoreductase [Actinophytocola sp.]|uniref:SDR family oxidoreductase n=1 Tax=Actinophytocola sp. TaxID=1872138 RepID=UPI002D403614|nr:SDR family oxidoreductase [Actinophytocola sp.]HYQ69305.1 SDR family oxidoreductase [Actinophytocola sp.]